MVCLASRIFESSFVFLRFNNRRNKFPRVRANLAQLRKHREFFLPAGTADQISLHFRAGKLPTFAPSSFLFGGFFLMGGLGSFVFLSRGI